MASDSFNNFNAPTNLQKMRDNASNMGASNEKGIFNNECKYIIKNISENSYVWIWRQ